METYKKIVFKILGYHSGVKVEKISSTDTLIDDLALDSLDIVECVMELEERFQIEIPDLESVKFRTVEDVVKYIEDNTTA